MNQSRAILVLSLSLCLILATSACAGAATTQGTSTTPTTRQPGSLDFPQLDYSIASTFPDRMNDVTDYQLTTGDGTYPTDAKAIEFTIENKTDVDRMTGAPYMLEIDRDGGWYSVPYKKLPPDVGRAWPAIAYSVPANGTYTGSIILTEYESLTPGHYRLVKEVTSIKLEEGFSVFICAEFDLK